MARRINASALRAGISPRHAQPIAAAFLAMIQHRETVVSDERDPDFLHTGRTAVIMLEDLAVADAAAIGASVLFDSLQPGLAAAAATLAASAGSGVPTLLAELTEPAADADLVEALVTASEAARIIAVTERLDHARHLHLRPRALWAGFHDDFSRLYLPLAHRTHPRLGYRCDRWATAFADRHLRR